MAQPPVFSGNPPPLSDAYSDKISAVLIEGDVVVRETLRQSLEQVPEVALLAHTDSYVYGYELIRQNQPKLVLIDLRDNMVQALQWVERISTYFRNTFVVVLGENLTLEGLMACMQAGAREYLPRPVSSQSLYELIQKHRATLMADTHHGDRSGRLLSVFSNKGGLGKTTLAVNLACALSEVTQKSVALVDLNLQLGDITTFLDLEPKQTVADLVRNLSRVDASYLENSLALYQDERSKVYVLADPTYVEESEEITAAQLNTLLTLLKNAFEYVIVDTTASFDSRTLTALDLSDHILLTSIINLPCIRSTQRMLALFTRLGYDEQKVKLLINRYVPTEDITLEDIEDTLERHVFWKLPNRFNEFIQSINRGVPVWQTDPSGEIWDEFCEMARRLSGVVLSKQQVSQQLAQAHVQQPESLAGKLFGNSMLANLFSKKS